MNTADRQLMQQALDALNSPNFGVHSRAILALQERLAQPFAMQVRPAEFVQIIKSKETLTGIPSYWAEWPNREQP
jgi:hypothetical protein